MKKQKYYSYKMSRLTHRHRNYQAIKHIELNKQPGQLKNKISRFVCILYYYSFGS